MIQRGEELQLIKLQLFNKGCFRFSFQFKVHSCNIEQVYDHDSIRFALPHAEIGSEKRRGKRRGKMPSTSLLQYVSCFVFPDHLIAIFKRMHYMMSTCLVEVRAVERASADRRSWSHRFQVESEQRGIECTLIGSLRFTVSAFSNPPKMYPPSAASSTS